MSPGKIASQAGHAYLGAFQASRGTPEHAERYSQKKATNGTEPALSQLIRELKFTRKRFDTSWPQAVQDHYRRIQKENTNQFGFYPQSLCFHYRQQATAMLEELKLAKAEAQRQYQEKHLQVLENT